MTLRRAFLRGPGSLVALFAVALSGCLLTTESIYRDSGPEVTTGPDATPDGVSTGDGGDAATDSGTMMGDGVTMSDAVSEGSTGDGQVSDGMTADADDVPDVVNPDADDVVDAGPPPEVCNGVDDNGNGQIDEGLPVISCGVGACLRTVVACVNGTPQTCTPGAPSTMPDQCDGRDNDCDGQTDEDVQPIQCGTGACGTTVPGCVNGAIPACPAPVAGSPETCGDRIDNDCNGLTDEGCPCDVYVSKLGRDAGAGTMADPINNINGGITAAVALGGVRTVCVGVTPSSSTGCGTATYLQDVVMQPNVIVLGGYRTDTWVRDTTNCRTMIQAAFSASGVVFGHNTNDFTVLDGFDIRSVSADGTLSAVYMQSCGTLSNNTIGAGNASGLSSGTSIAVDVPVPLVTPPTACTAPIIRGNRITAGPGGTSGNFGTEGRSIGIRAQRPVLIQANGRIEASVANQSFGILLDNAPGSYVLDNQLITAAPLAATNRSNLAIAAGVRVQGQADNVNIVRNGTAIIDTSVSRRGIYGMGGFTVGAGVYISGTNSDATPALVYLNGPIVGSSTPGLGIGVWADFTTLYIAYNESIVGRDTPGTVGIGVQCGGSTAACGVLGNKKVIGVQAPNGSGTNGTAAVGILSGSGAQLVAYQNRGVAGCTGAMVDSCVGISLDQARRNPTDPTAVQSVVDSNVIDANQGAGQLNAGIAVHDAPSLVSNNVVRTTGTGMVFFPDQGTTGVFHSNTVIVGGQNVSDAGVAMMAFHADTATTGTSAWINNIAMCVTRTTTNMSFAEVGQGTTPTIFQGNDLYNCGIAYRDSALGTLADVTAVNGLTDISFNGGNLAADPQFVDAPGNDFHLRPTSTLIDMGSALIPLPTDFEADPRPWGVGFDIGADEVYP